MTFWQGSVTQGRVRSQLAVHGSAGLDITHTLALQTHLHQDRALQQTKATSRWLQQKQNRMDSALHICGRRCSACLNKSVRGSGAQACGIADS